MIDARVPMAPILAAFGVAITVTTPQPSDGPVSTSGAWVNPLQETNPFGSDLAKRDPRRVMAIERTTALPDVPRGSKILAPEVRGGVIRLWRVDGFERQVVVDEVRVILVPLSDVL